jgi:membrane associated rhomboid family serine protease
MDERLSRRREPMFRAPWPVVGLVALLIAPHAWRVLAHASAVPLALTADDLAQHRWAPLITHIFTHGSWAHVLMNSAFCLVFGVPVCRFFGAGLRGGFVFFAFFLVCGLGAALGYAGLDPHGRWMLVGASGAASGLLGGASRLLEGPGRLSHLISRPVIAMTFGWIIVNAVLGLSGLTPGAAGVDVAWQAHILGFLIGLVLVGPFAWIAGARPRDPRILTP